jgi:outer membrane protein OmpA-like peptidoglycan-associated protein
MKQLKFILLAIFFVSGVSLSHAQTDGKRTKVKVNRNVMMADELVKSGSYYNAIDIYLQEFNEDADAYVAYHLADAYLKARDYKNSETWFKKAFTMDPATYPQAQYYLALSMKYNAKYQEAATEFKAFNKTRMKGTEAAYYKRLAKNELKGCDLAIALLEDPAEVEITHLNKNINNNYTDFSPRYNPDNDKLVYASLVSEEVIDMGANKKTELRSRIFEAKAQGESWAKGEQIAGPFNDSPAHTGNGSYSLDGKRFYFTECMPNDSLKMICNIYVSEYKNGEWSKPVAVNDVNIATGGFTTTQPAIGEYKGKEVLYFVSNREGTVGGMDIWYSEVRNKGAEYTTPQNCGRKINTEGDEITPFYSKKEDLLYFSSNGLINVGGLDIYNISGGLKSWKNPMNVGFPINSSVDDFYYSADTKNERTFRGGFFVSNRAGGYSVKSETCCDDIYQYRYIIPPVFTIMGKVYDIADSSRIDGAAINLLAGAGKVDSAASSSTKMFEFYRGSEFEKYTITAIKDGYYQGQAKTTTVGLVLDDTLYVDVYIEKIPIKKEIEIKNIYYELDKADLRPESGPSLDSLYNVMVNNPAIIAEVGSHTDSRGSDDYNLDLSQRRAQSVVNYLTGRGIDSARLVATGYGETKLKNKCKNGVKCSEEEHQINRRTEFTIIGEIPNTNITYNQAEIDAMKALERERQMKEDQDRQKRLEDLQTLDEEGGTEDGGDSGSTDTKTDDKAGGTTTATKAEVDTKLTKKGNLYEGAALVNGKESTTYLLNLTPSLTVAIVSDEFFVKMKAAGLVSDADFKNEKPTALSDGSTAKGDIFVIKSLQLGDVMLSNVDAKLNTSTPQNLVVGVKVIEKAGCTFDAKKVAYKCGK